MKRIVLTALLVTSCAWALTAGTIDSTTFHSSVLSRDTRYRVYLPSGYETKKAQGTRFPVVYLLHCAGCSESMWESVGYGNIRAAIDQYDLIGVSPYDGTDMYGYSWWLDSPKRPESQMASYIVQELKPRIDSLYATLPDRANTALSGHSMGGFGSMHLLIEHNDIFGIAAPVKAGLDIRNPLPPSWDFHFNLDFLLGTSAQDSANWQAVNVLHNAHRLAASSQHIRIYSGATDGWFAQENRKLDSILTAHSVAHDFIELAEDHYPVTPSMVLAICAWIDSVSARGPAARQPTRRSRPKQGKQPDSRSYDLRGKRVVPHDRAAGGIRIVQLSLKTGWLSIVAR